MNRSCRFSDVTKDYLGAFYHILDNMIQGMTEAELTDSISHNFITQMIPHHRGAIEMSKNILRYTTNVQVQDIAAGIVEEQTKSIHNMQSILCRCKGNINSEQDVCLYQSRMEQIMQTMFLDMRNARTINDINCNFMREMIPHHRGAVEMVSNAMRYDVCEELIPIMQAIYTSQRKGILQMQKLLRCLGC